ncbi:MAG: TIGR02646 family protein [Planctomycetaceae bacterium]|jgi:uncharacterized protein (TIGR02646 family)|nr:TIGR02646 family protein [Planctomycetaceae bacterium]
MKHIVKNSEPKEFIEWKNKTNENWQPTFESLRGSSTGKIVKQSLIEEQGGLCCYCERYITDDDSHFEHFRPQSCYKKDVLNYQNLLCSCVKEPKKETDRHCGHFKGDQFDEQFLISPLDPECENQFAYDSKGRIKPAQSDNEKATKTIDMLGLNNGNLPDNRKSLIDILSGGERTSLTEKDVDNITIDEQRKYAEEYLRRKDDNTFNEYWTTMKHLLTELSQSIK